MCDCYSKRERAATPGAGTSAKPSLVIAEPDPIPDLQFEDGATASL